MIPHNPISRKLSGLKRRTRVLTRVYCKIHNCNATEDPLKPFDIVGFIIGMNIVLAGILSGKITEGIGLLLLIGLNIGLLPRNRHLALISPLIILIISLAATTPENAFLYAHTTGLFSVLPGYLLKWMNDNFREKEEKAANQILGILQDCEKLVNGLNELAETGKTILPPAAIDLDIVREKKN